MAATSKFQIEPNEVSLIKGRERFIFRYELGSEAKLLDALADLVHNSAIDFDWFDAAVISHQVGQKLSNQLKEFIPKASRP